MRAVYHPRELRRTAEPALPRTGRARRGDSADSSGVEVLLDQGGDLVDGGLVVAGDLDGVPLPAPSVMIISDELASTPLMD